MRIGIPRALFFYHCYPLWKAIFENLDQEIILSKPTNKNIVKTGIELAVDDACLPVKVFYGHVYELKDKVDALFVPRIISIEPKNYICPKFLGLPDMIKVNIDGLPEIIDIHLNLYKGKFKILDHIFSIGETLGKTKSEVVLAYYKALKYFNSYKNNIREKNMLPSDLLNDEENFKNNYENNNRIKKYKILLLGHPYIVYDNFISMNIIQKLKKNNVELITYEMVRDGYVKKYANNLTKKELFWTLGKNIIGSAFYFLNHEQKHIDGIIHIASFGCGPDSLVGELLENNVRKKYNTPFLYLNVDEQSGEAGFNTRLEAFLDILERRKQIESNLPTYG